MRYDLQNLFFSRRKRFLTIILMLEVRSYYFVSALIVHTAVCYPLRSTTMPIFAKKLAPTFSFFKLVLRSFADARLGHALCFRSQKAFASLYLHRLAHERQTHLSSLGSDAEQVWTSSL